MLKRLLEFVSWIAVALPVGNVAVRAQADPAALAARDSHQGLLVAVVPYLSPQPYKDKFRARSPYDAGIVALEVYFRNDNDSPIRLNFDTVRLVIGESRASRQKIEALTPEEVTDRVTFMSPKDPHAGPAPSQDRHRPETRPRQELGGVGRGSSVGIYVRGSRTGTRHRPRLFLFRYRPSFRLALERQLRPRGPDFGGHEQGAALLSD